MRVICLRREIKREMNLKPLEFLQSVSFQGLNFKGKQALIFRRDYVLLHLY